MEQIKVCWYSDGCIYAWFPPIPGCVEHPFVYTRDLVWNPKTDQITYCSVIKDSKEYDILLSAAKKYLDSKQKAM